MLSRTLPCLLLLTAGCSDLEPAEVGTTRGEVAVTWTNLVGVSASGNDLTKTAGTAGGERLERDGEHLQQQRHGHLPVGYLPRTMRTWSPTPNSLSERVTTAIEFRLPVWTTSTSPIERAG